MKGEELFAAELKALRKFETTVIASANRFGANVSAMLLEIAGTLKESIYFFRSAENDSANISDYKYLSIRGEFASTIDKLFAMAESRPPVSVVEAIRQETKNLYQRLLNFSKEKEGVSNQSQEDIARLTRQMLEYRQEMLRFKSEAENLKADFLATQKIAEAGVAEATEEAVKATRAATEAVGGEVAKEWTEEYRQYIDLDDKEEKLVTKQLEENKKAASEDATKRGKKFKLWIDRQGLRIKWCITQIFTSRLFYEGKSYVNTVNRWRTWRTIWLMLLFVLAGVYFWVFHDYDFATAGFVEFFSGKLVFLPLIFVISLGFVFSTRNYKVNSHLLEQYRHRYIVARMMKNLISLDQTKDKSALLQEGSKVLFEFRNTGYMNKVEGESLTPKDILDVLIPRVNFSKRNEQGSTKSES